VTETILAIAAHPDDEILGLGATLARHAEAGDDVHIVIAAEGSTSRSDKRDVISHAPVLEHLKEAAATAARILGCHPPRMLGLPDNRMDSCDLLDVVKLLESTVSEIKPRVVYTHHAGDLNVDHRILYEATLTACRPLPGSTVRAIYAFETVSSTEWAPSLPFLPSHFVDAEPTWQKKMDALRAYDVEMQTPPHPRSLSIIEALATYRGSCVGLAKAEAFETIRQVQC